MIMRFLTFAAALMWHNAALANERYEALFASLAKSESRIEAQELTQEIWGIWLKAPDETAQEVLDAAMARRASFDFLGAIEHLDRLVEAYPDYAEGWNQRATMYYLINDYPASFADVEEVLAREPRHFGALSGKAVMLFNEGKLPLAQIVVREAIKVHPFLNERVMLEMSPGKDL